MGMILKGRKQNQVETRLLLKDDANVTTRGASEMLCQPETVMGLGSDEFIMNFVCIYILRGGKIP